MKVNIVNKEQTKRRLSGVDFGSVFYWEGVYYMLTNADLDGNSMLTAVSLDKGCIKKFKTCHEVIVSDATVTIMEKQ